MGAKNSLRQDHAALRKKLILLESALHVAPEVSFVLREMCFSLQRLLHDHMQREAQIAQPLLRHLTESGSRSLWRDHAESYALLRTVTEMLLSGMRPSMPVIVMRLSDAMERLRTQMDAQERACDLWPEPEAVGAEEEACATISGTMSVNEILQRFPNAERVFAHLRVNRLQEGYESVDEWAWYHGMDVTQVIEQLRQAVFAGN